MFKGTLESKVVDTFSPKPMSLKTSKHIKNIYSTNTTPKKSKTQMNITKIIKASHWNQDGMKILPSLAVL